LHQAIEALGSLGTCGIVGAEPLGTEVSFDVNNLMISVRGYAAFLRARAFPTFLSRNSSNSTRRGFPFEKLTKFYSLDQINQAAKDSEKAARSNPSFVYRRREREGNFMSQITISLSSALGVARLRRSARR